MNRRLSLVSALLLAALAFTACKPGADTSLPAAGPEDWQAFRSDSGKWGFKNGDKTVIEPKFDAVMPFRGDRTRVRLNGKFGFIDPSGKVVIEIKYDEAEHFREDRAMVKLGDKYGFLDRAGEAVVPLEYDYAESFEKGHAIVKKGDEVGLVTVSGEFKAGDHPSASAEAEAEN